MSAKIKYIESLIKEGKHTIALSELIALRDTVEKGSIEYGIVLKLLGSLYYYYAEFTISMDFLKSALEVFKQYKEEKRIIKIEVNIALIYVQIKNYDQALLLIDRILNYPNIENNVKWSLLSRKADIFHLLNKSQEARKLYNNLLSEIPAENPLYIQLLINSAINFYSFKQIKTADDHFSKAIELSTQFKQSRLLLYSKMNYASFLAENDQENEALVLFHECLEVMKENNVKISIRNISVNLAHIYESKNQEKEAQKHRKTAFLIDKELEIEKIKFQKSINN